MNENLEDRIIDPNLENDSTKYEVVLTGKFDSVHKINEAFKKAAEISTGGFLSVLIEKSTGQILIGDTHSKMRPGSRANPDEYSVVYARYDKASGKIQVMDYADFRKGEKTSQELKDMIAQKLQEKIYGEATDSQS